MQALLNDPSKHGLLLELVQSWPPSVFHPAALIDAIAQRMQRCACASSDAAFLRSHEQLSQLSLHDASVTAAAVFATAAATLYLYLTPAVLFVLLRLPHLHP